ncbi:hypothetical protein GGR28_000576 [Lewinella aquimaris]|uniref:Uncharacterized protein n=1 Tax=Neolewinella aquimaris TaxID=1835722 RepID=A0A840E2S3_9BACT|nr:hypothetical protein [Neolewinella aquimaris]MBB4077975.1 hypothetical protein [Neolewinella aquimaris]
MVDLFTGNFQYSIPLFEVGGYPINLSYSSDGGQEEEASWVGFGWTLNPGAISRQVRGLPDDFNGEEVIHRNSSKENVTTGISLGTDLEIFGTFGLNAALNFNYNNYSGFSFSQDYSPSINLMMLLSDDFGKKPEKTASSGKTGFRLKWPWQIEQDKAVHFLSANFTSRAGLQSISWSSNLKRRMHNFGVTYSTAGITYTPTSNLPKRLSARTFTVKAGGVPVWPLSAHAVYRGHSMTQSLATNVLKERAYGYLYLDGAIDDPEAIMDYNVETGGLLNQDATRLPVPFGTPDVYAVTGPSMSGQIEVIRNRMSPFRPAKTRSGTVSVGSGGDIGVGSGIHLGANYSASKLSSELSGWDNIHNTFTESYESGIDVNNPESYLRYISDQTSYIDKTVYDRIGGPDPVHINVASSFPNIKLTTAYKTENRGVGRLFSIGSSNLAKPLYKESTATVVNYLTHAEANAISNNSANVLYQPFTSPGEYFSLVPILESWSDRGDKTGRMGHHISQINVLRPSGQRYEYGLPVYNHHKQEVTFNAAQIASTAGKQGEGNYGLVDYEGSETLLTLGNNSGNDHLFDEVVTPAHPVAHLLTSVLSPDYVDVTGNGISSDDLGNYVKLGYTTVVDPDPNVNQPAQLGYRTPAAENSAALSEGNLADPTDDKASFTYGTKEVYYVHHIDSKTHRAVFHTSPRVDAIPVDEDGRLENESKRLQKLDYISLFTLAELNRAESTGTPPIPIKEIHFEYADHGSQEQISTGLPNSLGEKGKLTLRAVHFTYADNDRGALNKYQFTYKVEAENAKGDLEKVAYRPFMLDRWGTRKMNSDVADLDPIRYPYAVQDASKADEHCDIGNLIKIDLPTGASIEVEYEPDDYAYVQNFRAGKMYTLAAITNEFDNIAPQLPQTRDQLYVPDGGLGDAKLYAYIKVGDIPTEQDPDNLSHGKIKDLLLSSVDQLYFSALVRLQKGISTYERITGYAGFDKDFSRVFKSGEDYYLVLKLTGLTKRNSDTGNERSINPITFASLDKMQYELPRLLYGDYEEADVGRHPESLIPRSKGLGKSMQNFYKWRLNRDIADAQFFKPEASYVRLSDPHYKKIGGGSRVNKVVLQDNWLANENEVAEPGMTYAKTYSYQTQHPISGQSISTGVAANEPMHGKEEMLYVNVGKTPHPRFLGANRFSYMENPAGLSFFPAANVGYSMVTVQTDLDEKYAQSIPGRTVHEFYTARDYPVKVHLTELDRAKVATPPSLLPFVSLYQSRLALSQGFTIETNDMHGKMKGVFEYGVAPEAISSTRYNYSTDPNAGDDYLNNSVSVVESGAGLPSGSNTVALTEDYLGLRANVWMEITHDRTTSYGGGIQANADISFPFLFALTPYPNINSSVSSLQTAAVTKYIHRTGILEEVLVMNNGSTLTTTNHRFDALTGAPVLTSTQNEFGQPVYQLASPAYWMKGHEGMGPAYRQQQFRVQAITILNGRLQGTDVDEDGVLVPGDELIAYEASPADLGQAQRLRVFAVKYYDHIRLIDDAGNLVDTPSGVLFNLRLVRSGFRNVLNALSEQTTALIKPDGTGGLYYAQNQLPGASSSVIATSSSVYSEDWGNLCTPIAPYTPTDNCAECIDCSECPECLQCPDEPCTSPPCAGDCDELMSRINNSPIYIEYCGGEKFAMQGENWLAQIEDIKDCGACQDLFDVYSSQGFISNLSAYGECEQIGDYLKVTPQTDDQRALIANCAFVEVINDPHDIFGGGYVRIGQINQGESTCQLYPPDNRMLCDEPESSGMAMSSYIATPTVRLTSGFQDTTSCFPWHPDAGINPYLDGRRGNWRVKATYIPDQTNRSFAAVEADPPITDERDNNYSQPLLHEAGTLEEYYPFWFSETETVVGEHHIAVNRVNRFDEHGHELETKDALNIFSGAQYGFLQNLPVSVAQNARHTDIGFDNFEDYLYERGSNNGDWLRHFAMLDREILTRNDYPTITDAAAHTGRYSFHTSDASLGLNQSFATLRCDSTEVYCPDEEGCGSCVNGFRPTPNETYLASIWVASTSSLAYGQQPRLSVTSGGAQYESTLTVNYIQDGGTVQLLGQAHPTGPVVEGWQQIQLEFTVPQDASDIVFSVDPPSSLSSGETFYFDDVRVRPYESEMTAYVYDNSTLRLMAQIDDRGYAVFYEYDDEGMLVRQKRETERGVMTITEQHTNLAPASPQ